MNIMNDMYAKDISRKIKSAKCQQAYRGMYIAAHAPYGYKVDPQAHNHLGIDDAVATSSASFSIWRLLITALNHCRGNQ